MDLFLPIFTQMLVLFAFIAIGFLLAKFKVVPTNANAVLSKLENFIFVPALVMGTFITNCTTENISTLWKVLLFSVILLVVLMPLSFLAAKFLCKDGYIKKITIYGLVFSNFGFMGNAVVKAVFPELFFNYTVFTLPFWFAIYAWGVPTLLIGENANGEKRAISSRLKNFINPMLIAMLVGMVIGLTGLKLPEKVTGAVDLLGDCMSPIAMILTGITVANSDIKRLLKSKSIYGISAIRLVAFPLLFTLAVMFLPKGEFLTETVLLCGICMTAMPMGLNSIVIPAAYGKDTSFAAALAVITTLLSVITIPLMYLLFTAVVL